MPKTTIYVGRPTVWGNPFRVIADGSTYYVQDVEGNYWGRNYQTKPEAARKAVECYTGYIDAMIGLKRVDIESLRGHDLACFCSENQPCHADYLLQLLNTPIPNENT